MHVFALKYIKIVDKDFQQKCDAFNFKSDKDKVKIHNIKEQSFTLCHTFDKKSLNIIRFL